MNLFRSLRSKSINGNEIKKYLSYAIGEILLVVIGILLALQVDNWKQEKIDQKKERKAITDLYEEFNLNKQRIEDKQNKRIAVVPQFEQYISSVASNTADYNTFTQFHTSEYASGMTNPSYGVIDALISSGELSLISNDSLKYLIADWKDQAGNLRENEVILWNVALDYGGYYQKYVSVPNSGWKDFSNITHNNNYKAMLSQIEYRNKLLSFRGCNGIVIEECKSTLASIDKIMAILQTEMKKDK
jgi:type II secretory pathway pseudopilin PulG